MSLSDPWKDKNINHDLSSTFFKKTKLTRKDNQDFVHMILTKENNLKQNYCHSRVFIDLKKDITPLNC